MTIRLSRPACMIALAAALSAATAVWAQDAPPFQSEIKARQGLMQMNALNIAILGKMAKGEMPYDAAQAKAAADALAGVYALDLPMLWPAGSDNGAVKGTNALPAIWAEGSDIGAKVEGWGKAVAAMQTAAPESLDSLKAAMEPLGGACGSCHKAFRASSG